MKTNFTRRLLIFTLILLGIDLYAQERDSSDIIFPSLSRDTLERYFPNLSSDSLDKVAPNLSLDTLEKYGEMEVDTISKYVQSWTDYLINRDQNKNYIANYSDKIGIKLVGVSKLNSFSIIDRNQDSYIRYRPDFGLNLGFGIAYKFLSMDFTFNTGIREDSELQSDNALDIQIHAFSSKQYFNAVLHVYRGFRIWNTGGLSNELKPSSEIRDDIRKIQFELQYYYSFNYDKFSFKAPFIQNEIQKRSVGSWIIGASYGMFIFDSDSSMVPQAQLVDFNPALHLLDLNVINVSLNFGYMYSLVSRSGLFVTLGIFPGLALNLGDFNDGQRTELRPQFDFSLKSLSALGFNGKDFYGGIQFNPALTLLKLDHKARMSIVTGRAKFFFGYRIAPKKKKKKSKSDL